MDTYKSAEVFTPTSIAKNTFVEREAKINNHFVDALMTPGKQIVLYGYSGCGKSTLLINKLNQVYEKSFFTRCIEGMTFESILLDGFDKLSEIYTEQNTTKGFKIAPEVSVNYHEIKANFKLGEYTSQKSESQKKIIPPQLTPDRLGRFYGAAKACWVLEDFHKITGIEKTKISQMMKVFMDMSDDFPNLKIIALGAVGTARQVVEYDKEMNNRVAEIFIPYMKTQEIEAIIDIGSKLLNLVFSKDVKNKIVKYSYGLPSICHQLCLNICFNKKIYETPKNKTSINIDDLDKAIEKFVEEKSDTLKSEFDKAIKIGNNVKNNFPLMILRSCIEINKDEFSLLELIEIFPGKISEANLSKNLSELCLASRSEILVYDENSNLYRFNNLFLKAYTNLRISKDVLPDMSPKKFMKNTDLIHELLKIIEKDIYYKIDDYYTEEDLI